MTTGQLHDEQPSSPAQPEPMPPRFSVQHAGFPFEDIDHTAQCIHDVYRTAGIEPPNTGPASSQQPLMMDTKSDDPSALGIEDFRQDVRREITVHLASGTTVSYLVVAGSFVTGKNGHATVTLRRYHCGPDCPTSHAEVLAWLYEAGNTPIAIKNQQVSRSPLFPWFICYATPRSTS